MPCGLFIMSEPPDVELNENEEINGWTYTNMSKFNAQFEWMDYINDEIQRQAWEDDKDNHLS